jgi:hypothetical protein
MHNFQTIESWASSVGYVVEKDERLGYVWHRENEISSRSCPTVSEVMDAVLEEIRRSYRGEK